MLLLGGAIKEPCKIDKIMSQTDLPATVLGQLDIPHEEFIFSRDVLADTYIYPFAIHLTMDLISGILPVVQFMTIC